MVGSDISHDSLGIFILYFLEKIIHSKMSSDVADLVIKSFEIGDRSSAPISLSNIKAVTVTVYRFLTLPGN